MRKWTELVAACGIGLAITIGAMMLFSSLPLLSQGKVSTQDVTIQNGGFEGEYVVWEEGLDIAPSWKLWYKTDWSGENYLDLPCAQAVSSPKREGEKAQHVYPQGSKNFDACVYQQIGGITVGHYIQFSVWGQVDTTMAIPDAQTRIGIDPNGGTDPLEIQYELHTSNWDVYDTSNGEWQKLSVIMKATSPTATVYVCAHPRWPMSFHVYWDDAQFSTASEKLVYLPIVTKNYFVIPPGELLNPGFERDYGALVGYQTPISGFDNVMVAPYWMPFWNDDYDSETWENKQPEYNYTDRSYRVHSGEVAQQMGLSGWGSFEAGLYQVITGTKVSDTLKFTIWGHGWSSDDPGNERYSNVRKGLNFRVGIDPYGGEFYTATNIIWSAFKDPYDEWQQFEITATAQYTRISVWAYAHPAEPKIRFNQTFWDNASLSVVHSP